MNKVPEEHDVTPPPTTRQTGSERRSQGTITRTYRCEQCRSLHVTCLRLERCPECGARLGRDVQA